MTNIIGDEKLINRVRAARPSDKSIHVCLEMLDELPDEYEPVITEVTFDPRDLSKSFTNVGTTKNPSWYPHTELMLDIANKRGISGGDNSIVEPIYEDVEINEMYMSDNLQVVKKKVGYIVRKFSTVLQEDGTLQRSPMRTGMCNAWEDCVALWAKEEEATNGYDPKIVKQYPSGDKYYEYTWNNQTQKKNLKYDTKWKRKAHFTSELNKKAMGKADTTAHLKTIRDLAGLKTGYTTDDLSSGSLVFVKIRRSRKAIKMETTARLAAIGSGAISNPTEAAVDLYGTEPPQIEEQPRDVTPQEPVAPSEPTPEPTGDLRTQLMETMQFYIKEGMIQADEQITNMMKWMTNSWDDGKTGLIDKIKNRITETEKTLDAQQKYPHNLF